MSELATAAADIEAAMGEPEEIEQEIELEAPEPREEPELQTDDQLTDDVGVDDEEEEVTANEDAFGEEDEGVETATLESLEEVAEALEVPFEEFLDNFKLSFNSAGENVTATLQELQTSYQLEADNRRKSEEIANERKDFAVERQDRRQEFESSNHVVAQVHNFHQQMLMNEVNSPQMAELRQSNPSEWSAKQTEFSRRQEMLNGVRQKAAEEYSAFVDKQRSDFIAEQGRVLSETVEGWGEEKLGVAVGAIKSFGFDDSEIADIGDARLIKAALQFRELEQEVETLKAQIAKGNEAVEKVKKLPKPTLTAKGKTTPSNPKAAKIKALKQRLKANPTGRKNTESAAALIEELI